jgi:hypothetical protein
MAGRRRHFVRQRSADEVASTLLPAAQIKARKFMNAKGQNLQDHFRNPHLC